MEAQRDTIAQAAINTVLAQKPAKRSRDVSLMRMRYRDLLSAARTYHPTQAELLAQLAQLRDHFNLPIYEWEYVRAYRDAVIDTWMGPKQHGGCIASFYKFGNEYIPCKWDLLTDAQREVVKHVEPSKRDGSDGCLILCWTDSNGAACSEWF